MKNWKDHPHLFANGKFEVRVDYGAKIASWILYVRVLAEINRNNLMQNCQLIARPIEDMTAEEWDEIRGYNEVGFHHEDGRDVIYTTALSAGLMLHLLSIGVYPFFDTEDVIFKPKHT